MNDASMPPTRGPLPPTILLAAITLMAGLHLILPLMQSLASPWRLAAGAFVLLAGVVINVWTDGLFKQAGTSVKPFEPTSTLIVTGPFAFSRNPMYFGMALALVGIAIAFGSASPWLVIPLYIWQIEHRFIIVEEQKLEGAFGTQYLEYKASVPRWI